MTLRRFCAGWVLAVMALSLVAGPARALDLRQVNDHLPAELRAWVDDHGPLRVGYFATGAPVGIVENGEVTGGWGFELFSLMGIKLGVAIESVVFPTVDAAVLGLRSGEIDLIAAAGARPDLLAFATSTDLPVSWTPVVLAGGTDQQVLGLDQVRGRTFTTIKGSPLVGRVKAVYPELTYVEFATIPAGIEAVAAGDVDLYAGPLAVIGHQLTQLGLTLGPVGRALDVVEVFPWGRQGDEAIQVANIGRSLLTDVELSVVHVRWTGFDLGNPDQPLATWVVPTIVSALAALGVLAVFALVLRRRVERATADLTELNAELEARVAARTAEVEDANERLRATNQALTGFARSAAHDLRGPVTAIAGLTQLMQTIELPKDRVDQTLDTIRSSATRLNDMIYTLLEDAVRAGAAEPTLDGPDFKEWLLAVLAPEAEAIDAQLTVTTPEGELAVDAGLLRRVAVNLAGNALKYAVNESHGCVVLIDLHDAGDGQWRLTVEDNGPGVPAPLWGKIFEKGYQAAGRADRSHGFGMGLADVRQQLQKAGGTVQVADSELGGARFVVTLPAVGRQAATASTPSTAVVGPTAAED